MRITCPQGTCSIDAPGNRAYLERWLWVLGCAHQSADLCAEMERWRDQGHWLPYACRFRGEEAVDLSVYPHLRPKEKC